MTLRKQRFAGKQIASTVQWVKGLQTLYANGVRTFVEVGPKRALRGFANDMHLPMIRSRRADDQSSQMGRTGNVQSSNLRPLRCRILPEDMKTTEVQRHLFQARRSDGYTNQQQQRRCCSLDIEAISRLVCPIHPQNNQVGQSASLSTRGAAV